MRILEVVLTRKPENLMPMPQAQRLVKEKEIWHIVLC